MGQVQFHAIPTILFLKPDGTEVGRMTGYRGPADFLKEANSILAGKQK